MLPKRPCKCGSYDVRIETWTNLRTRGEEYFVRCIACRESGKGAATPDDAVEKWEAFACEYS